MKKILISILFFIPLLASAQSLDVRLKNIRYYNGDCGKDNPVKVRVCFAANVSNLESMTMVIKYDNSITLTKEVRESDGAGNIYYSFCSKMGEPTNFEICFRDRTGKTSDNFAISATPEEYKIVEYKE